MFIEANFLFFMPSATVLKLVKLLGTSPSRDIGGVDNQGRKPYLSCSCSLLGQGDLYLNLLVSIGPSH